VERITAERLAWVAAVLVLLVALIPCTDIQRLEGEQVAFRITVEFGGVIFIYDTDNGVTVDGSGLIPDGGESAGGGGGGAG